MSLQYHLARLHRHSPGQSRGRGDRERNHFHAEVLLWLGASVSAAIHKRGFKMVVPDGAMSCHRCVAVAPIIEQPSLKKQRPSSLEC